MSGLQGRHAIITGGGRGIGAAIAVSLATTGAKLTLLGRDAQRLDEHAAKLRAQGAQVRTGTCDVSDESSVAKAFALALNEFGTPFVLVNNAGQARGAKMAELSLDEWNRTLSVNLTGAFLCARAVLPGMLAANEGRIVNVASTAGLRGYARLTAYCASKHGLVGLTRALAAEVVRTGITVNAVCPGYTETDMTADGAKAVASRLSISESEARQIFVDQIPRGTMIQPDEVASCVLWLCSPGASGITGQAIAIAGGEV